MGITDKITGRVKKAAGDLTDDASLRREGRTEERKGEAKEELSNAQERADAQGRRGCGPGAQVLTLQLPHGGLRPAVAFNGNGASGKRAGCRGGSARPAVVTKNSTQPSTPRHRHPEPTPTQPQLTFAPLNGRPVCTPPTQGRPATMESPDTADQGYPEEQPDEVAGGTRGRSRAAATSSAEDDAPDNEDGTATGNP